MVFMALFGEIFLKTNKQMNCLFSFRTSEMRTKDDVKYFYF